MNDEKRSEIIVSVIISTGDEFVDKYYEMDPTVEDLVYGTDLTNGVMVLIEDPRYRVDISELKTDSPDPELLREAKKSNRRCIIEKYSRSKYDRTVSFIGVYEDGTKYTRRYAESIGWYVLADSVQDDDTEGGSAE